MKFLMILNKQWPKILIRYWEIHSKEPVMYFKRNRENMMCG